MNSQSQWHDLQREAVLEQFRDNVIHYSTLNSELLVSKRRDYGPKHISQ